MEDDPLDPDKRDRMAAVARAAAGVIPWVGTAIGEFLTAGIREQRLDRVAKFVRLLEDRLAALEQDSTALLASAEKADLIEEGVLTAARALSGGRIEQIAEVVSRGLDASEAEAIRQKRLLRILEQLDDEEIAMLHAMERRANGDSSGWERLGRPPNPAYGGGQELIKPFQLFEAGHAQLVQLGLVRGQQTADGGTKNFKITDLGRVLLEEIGLPVGIRISVPERQSGTNSDGA